MRLSTSALLISGLAAHQVAATWDRHAASFTNPYNANNECTNQQKSGYSWAGLATGSFSSYDAFSFTGAWSCSNSFNKRDALTKRTFGSKCAKTSVSQSAPAAFSCTKSTGFSVTELQVSVEFDCQLEFHYGMEDGSTCKQVSSCKKEGTVVQNTQCGGAKTVQIYLGEHQEQGKDSCEIGLHNIGFNCDSNTSSSVASVPTPSSAGIPVAYTSVPSVPSVPSSSAEVPTSSVCNGYSCTPSVASSSTVLAPTSIPETTPSVPSSVATVPAYTNTPSVAQPSSSSIVIASSACVPGQYGCGASSVVSVPESSAVVTVPASTETPAIPSSSVVADTSSDCVPGQYGCGASTLVTVPATSSQEVPATTLSSVETPAVPSSAAVSSAAVSSAAVSSAAVSSAAVSSAAVSSAAVSSAVESSAAVSSAVESSAVESSVVLPTESSAVATTPAVYTSIAESSVASIPESSAASVPASSAVVPASSSGPAGYSTALSPASSAVVPASSSGPAGYSTALSPASSAVVPASSSGPADYSTALSPASTAVVPSSVPSSNCPGVLPQCMNTWMSKSSCKDNTDYSCYCKNSDFTKNVIECVSAWGADSSEVQAALSYLVGICAPYVPQNPGLVTNCPTSVTLTVPAATPASSPAYTAPAAPGTTLLAITTFVSVPASGVSTVAPVASSAAGYTAPVTTITLVATVTVPCVQAGSTVVGSSTTTTTTTLVTVPQVAFTTNTYTAPGATQTQAVNLAPGTPAPVYATQTGVYATQSFGTIIAPQPTNGTATSSPIPQFTGAASALSVGSFATVAFGAVMALFVL